MSSIDSIELLEKKKIKINAKIVNDSIEITVYDNGSGISNEIKDDIFIPFFTTKE